MGSRGIPLRSCTFALPEPPCYTTHQATDLVPRGPSQERNKESYEPQQPDQLSSHPGPARPPGHRHAPPPSTLSYQAMEGPSTTRGKPVSWVTPASAPPSWRTHPRLQARGTTRHPRVPGGHRAPARLPRRFLRNSPIPRRRDGGYARPPPNGRKRLGFIPLSGLPRLGTPLSHGDSETPVHPETAKSSALPSLRMVERLPHTDRPQGASL